MAARTKRGRAKGTANFKVEEIKGKLICDFIFNQVQCMKIRKFYVAAILEVIAEVLPGGKYGWDKVASEYNACRQARFPERDEEAIKRKFR